MFILVALVGLPAGPVSGSGARVQPGQSFRQVLVREQRGCEGCFEELQPRREQVRVMGKAPTLSLLSVRLPRSPLPPPSAWHRFCDCRGSGCEATKEHPGQRGCL